MSCSRLMTRMANPQASTIGTSGRGSSTSRLPSRAVGMVSSSRFSAKYEAKKMQSTILANLHRLELERPDLDPQPGAVDVAPRGRGRGAAAAGRRPRPAAGSGSGRGPGTAAPRHRVRT